MQSRWNEGTPPFPQPVFFLFVWLPVTFATMKPATKPIAMVSGISIIWDMPTFQKKSRKVTGWIFWMSMTRNRAIRTSTTINLALIINPFS
jgi:hypothetical protein